MLPLFLLAAATAAQPVPRATAVDKGSWFTAEDYPLELAMKGVEGSVRVEVDVDAAGKATACRVVRSSGSDSLDTNTCAIIMERAKFAPAKRRGRPVAGQYADNIVWRLEGPSMPPNGYRALIFDLKDPQHPQCRIVEKDMPSGPTCEEALKHYAAENVADITSLAVLMTMTVGDEKPYGGDPAWGKRTDFSAVDLFATKGLNGRPACVVVEKQGQVEALDPCAQYPDGSKLSDAEKKSAVRMHQEESRFVIMRDAGEVQRRKCKSGESAGEAAGCV